MKGIITVDIGTTSMRAVLYDADGRQLHIDQHDNAPQLFDDGRVEQDPALWPGILRMALKSCADWAADAGIEPLCIAVTAQRSSVIPIGRDGRPLHPAIMWQDRRTAELALAMDGDNPLVYRKSGLKISPVFSAIKILWLRRNRPEIWRQTHKMIGIQDWAVYLLTGRYATDHSFGSRTNLMNLEQRKWDPELLSLFEVEEGMLCELVAPGSIVGGLTSELAAASGLPDGLPVVSAGGDQQCAALGLGLFTSGRAVSNTGTGSFLIAHSDRPAFDPQMRLACNVSAVPGAYIVEAAVLTTGTIYRWFRETLVVQNNAGLSLAGTSFADLDAAAERSPAGANDLLLLPHFKGSGAPYWDPDAKGVFYNLTLSTTRGDMVRAILEGIAVELKASLELLETLCGDIDTVTVSGGMTKSDLFNQIQSDLFARPVVRFANNEATALGAWVTAAVAMGLAASHAAAFTRASAGEQAQTYRPNPANRALYERQCRRAQALYQALASPAFRELMA